ncbi:hypothetical protein [Ramlibacter sp.]|uniref:rhamnosyltransferase WsaF family glycosyltransferase n=1 Tax=Ramlibacter sp. TaxID=1917967 RepID=UPI003D12AC0C
MFDALERALRHQRIHGTRSMLREMMRRVRRRLGGTSATAAAIPGIVVDDAGWVNARELVRKHRQACAPLRLFTIPRADVGRITLVTDSINRGSLYGGVGTSLIFAALLARARGERLRLLTRTEKPQPGGLQTVLGAYGIALDHEVEFAFAPFYDERYEVDAFEDEQFITTSWWTTSATLGAVASGRIVYLLQEDERMFYPHGDEHLRASQVMSHPDLRFVVNTRLLFDHLVGSGLANVERNGMWFEPSFPPAVFRPAADRPPGKRTLFFYARPNNVRNLFVLGLDVLETAIARGVIDLATWDIVFVGKDIPRIRLDDGRYTPQRLENLDWGQYAALAGRTDLALCLMYTPHPSYPPFDLAASGAVVVSNRFANKQDLGGYSANILCADANTEALVAALADGARLALDTPAREANFRAGRLGTDWKASFASVIGRLATASATTAATAAPPRD